MRVPLPDDPILPTDAPPSYDGAIQTDQGHSPEKSAINDNGMPIQTSSPLSRASIEFAGKAKGKRRDVSSCDIRNSILGLLRDLVQVNTSTPSASVAVSILNSCRDACAAHGVSFSDILQTRNIEGHTALYWAIVVHREAEMKQGPDLLTSLISHAFPLKEETITEIRQACLAILDQNLFERLKQWPGVARMPAVDQMLLGATTPLDEIEVEELEDSFAMNFVIPQFRKRMAVSKSIQLEFIARGRLWRLKFLVAREPQGYNDPPAGSWCISLSLQESSPTTHIDPHISIFAVVPADSPSCLQSHQSKDISIRLPKTQLEARGKGIMQSVRNIEIMLQYNNCYIGSDEKLRGKFKADLKAL